MVVLTGAGVSVASGLRPYRGPGGLWTDQPELAARMTAGAAPDDLWHLFGPLRGELARAEPNAAHRALAALEARVPLTVITQNIDGLHQRAGSQSVVELHGALGRSRCVACDRVTEDLVPHVTAPRCECGGALRPDVVLFEEPLPVDAEYAAKRALRDCDLFLAIGTSGTVSPASNFVRSAGTRARTPSTSTSPRWSLRTRRSVRPCSGARRRCSPRSSASSDERRGSREATRLPFAA